MAKHRKLRKKSRRQNRSRAALSRSPHSRTLRCELLEDRRMLSVVTVDTQLDTVDFNDGVTSLREAIFATNLIGGADTIEFDAALAGETILLTQGELAITDSLTINGLGANQLTIDADLQSRIFNIDDNNASTNIDVEIRGLTLTRGMASGDNGGAIRSQENLVLADSVLTGNSAMQGGAIDSSSEVTVTSSTITNNSAERGGGISGNAFSTVTIIDSQILNNTASDGGGIWARISTTTITGSTISGNSASNDGAGIWARSRAITIADSMISGNSAGDSGGGIYGRSTTVTITGSTISDNSAGNDGGGIVAYYGTAAITDSTISGNSTGIDGGGIWARGNTITITDSTISVNSAGDDGGGIYVLGTTTTMTGSTILDNSASDNGGGILTSGGAMAITDSTISNNSARDRSGGGIWAFNTLAIIDSTISENSAGNDGGGIYVKRGSTTITGSSISGNSAGIANRGGGIWAYNTLAITDSTISGNSTGFYGGGIYARSSVTITGSTISENSGARGGGLWTRYGTATISGSTISGNSTTVDGGGIYAGSTTTTITDSTISDNSAGDEGGGIWARTSTTTITGSAISNNSAVNNGGGIWTNGSTTIAGSTISGNSAGDGGGGIFTSNTTTTITGSTISNNSAGGNGGGIQANNTTTIAYSTISENLAGGSGGGIWADNRFSGTTTTITGSTISGNLAGDDGGGIFIDVGAGAGVISHSTIVGNRSDADRSGSGSGGGLFLPRGTLTIDHSIVAQNRDNTIVGQDLTGFLGVVFDLHFSLIGDNTGSGLAEAPVGSPDVDGNLIGDPTGSGAINPLLGPLADNGGLIQTRALLAGSPAIDAGDPAIASPPATDQRGAPFVRIFGAAIDIGAYERQDLGGPQVWVVDTLADENDGDYSAGDFSLREAIILANGSVDTADVVMFDPSLAGGTILLTMGELKITDSLTINGLGADLLTIDASGNDPTPDSTPLDNNFSDDGDGSRIFSIFDGQDFFEQVQKLTPVTISGLSLTGGDVYGGGAIATSEMLTLVDVSIYGNFALGNEGGGGISAQSIYPLSIISSTISDNLTGGAGGGVRVIAPLSIIDSTISNNRARLKGGGIWVTNGDVFIEGSTISGNTSISGRGGGIRFGGSYRSMTIRDSRISDNTAGSHGGGVYARGETTISGSTVSGNSADGNGGGVYTRGEITISESTVSGNSADERGGGLFFGGASTRITDTLISANFAADAGGGLATTGNFPFEIVNSTISGNSTFGDGGGVRFFYVAQYLQATLSDSSSAETLEVNAAASGQFVIANTTITDNRADSDADGNGSGGGIYSSPIPSLKLNHTIVAGNRRATVDEDLARGNYDVYYGLIGAVAPDATLSGASILMIGVDPLLGPLADNGGPTLTHALLPGSPAIDAGDPAAVAGVDGIPEYDQRGFPYERVFGGRIDIGAFERQPLPGDFNGDNEVDGADFLAWQRGVSTTSGIVDSNDLRVWQRQFGATEPLVGAVSSLTTVSAPLSVTAANHSPSPSLQETEIRNTELVDLAVAVELANDFRMVRPETADGSAGAFSSIQRTTSEPWRPRPWSSNDTRLNTTPHDRSSKPWDDGPLDNSETFDFKAIDELFAIW